MPEATVDGDVLRGEPPSFNLAEAADIAERLFGLRGNASPVGSERDQGFVIGGPTGPVAVLKISNASEDRAVVDMETAAALHVLAVDPSLPVAAPLRVLGADPNMGRDAFVGTVEGRSGFSHLVRASTHMPGTASIDPPKIDAEAAFDYGVVVARLARAMRAFFHPSASRVLMWDVHHAASMRPLLDAIADPDDRALLTRALDRFETSVLPRWSSLRSQVIHGDVTLDNALVDERGRITGIVDFGDMSHTALVCDLSSSIESLLVHRAFEDVVPIAMRVVDGYRSITALEPEEVDVLPDLVSVRAMTDAVLFGWRAALHPDNAYLQDWAEVLPLLRYMEDEGNARFRDRLLAGGRTSDGAALLDRRARAFGPALSPLTYDRPLHLVRGEGVWLMDANGERFLDCYNNVPVVGHAHPRVSDAIARQSRLLNTNMRYLTDAPVELAERLVATMPEGSGLDTVLFVNSGSEANDTAWRLATAWTGGRGALVTRFAYHGVTEAIAAISPEEWLATGKPDHVETFDPVDAYRDPDLDMPASLATAAERLRACGIEPAATFVDGGFTSDGIPVPSVEAVRALADRTHDAGALYVADEVQVGHARSGAHLWSFAGQGVAADIVTLGKPMGNGHPVAALIARRELTERFAETTEWFSTFGGNPVACAAALAVLDVIEDEQLIACAARVGPALRAALAEVQRNHEAIGDVRGIGMLTGVELVRDPMTKDPDPELTDAVANGMRARGVLVGTTGRAGNVLKVRPPLVFGDEHIVLVAEALDAALYGLGRLRVRAPPDVYFQTCVIGEEVVAAPT
ncbi:MAG TPA: aminotransferase class III-fold pyridoxal phosphate-dependent enzyme [Actinomycetota bacterium]|nr:aminotransferase class III-fold pyridoxal phosphate-dependent enzyme [Actinomycetota bacterium]